jgi:hypothetical protein
MNQVTDYLAPASAPFSRKRYRLDSEGKVRDGQPALRLTGCHVPHGAATPGPDSLVIHGTPLTARS